MRLFLVTIGTSVLTNFKRSGGDSLERFVQSAPMEELSAESHSLMHLNWDPADKVVFLHTVTEDGERCARLLKARLEQGAESSNLELEGIPGLEQTGEAFDLGLEKFGKGLVARVRKAKGTGLLPVIVATGGFKVTAMVAAAAAALEGVAIYYIRQDFGDLAELPLRSLRES